MNKKETAVALTLKQTAVFLIASVVASHAVTDEVPLSVGFDGLGWNNVEAQYLSLLIIDDDHSQLGILEVDE